MSLIFKKEINPSMFNRGFSIPVKVVPVLSTYLKGVAPVHGEKRAIKILLNGEIFDATLTSVGFNRDKYPKHKDMWQIVYGANSPIAKKFAEIFARSRAANFNLPETEREYFAFYATDVADMFSVEPIFNAEISAVCANLDEVSIEHLLEFDDNAALVEKFRLEKIRHLNRSIGDDLKKFYKFRCQICGKDFGRLYGVRIAECHHIDYFVRSLNNDASNLLILCPNHHRIIHAAEPVFDRENKIFRYDDGSCESLTLNGHL